MSDEPTKPMSQANDAPEPERQNAAPNSGNAANSSSQGRNTGAWLVVGCLGCAGVLAVAAFIGGIAYIVMNMDDEETDVATTPTVEVADEPTPTLPDSTEPDEDPEPDPDSDPGENGTFGDELHMVGEDIEPGLYFANDVEESCYWERLSGLSDDLDDVITNNFSDFRQIVQIEETDLAFSSSRCGEWEQDAAPVRDDPAAELEDGMYLVGDEVEPGTWRSESSDEECYWARLSGFTGELDDVITNHFGDAEDDVQIGPDDVGFESSRCGPWVRVGG